MSRTACETVNIEDIRVARWPAGPLAHLGRQNHRVKPRLSPASHPAFSPSKYLSGTCDACDGQFVNDKAENDAERTDPFIACWSGRKQVLNVNGTGI